jgi:hypothetical protein
VRDTREVRATGLQGDASAQIIEIIDDDVDVFGDRPGETSLHDAGGPRWVGPVAALALVAIIGYGIVTSASTSSVPSVAPAPSTTAGAPTTTPPAPTTTEVPQPLVPYYSADPPRQFTVESAETVEPAESSFGPGFYQLWATNDASATTGSWFSVETYAAGLISVYATDAYRVQTARGPMAVAHVPGGQTTVQFAPTTSSMIALTAFGMDDATVIQLAESIDVVRSHVQFDQRQLFADFRVLSTVHPWAAIGGNPAEQIYYTDGNDPMSGVGITVSPRSASTIGGSTFDRQTALRFFLYNSTTFEVDGHLATAGEVIGQHGYSVATWIANDHIVTVTGQMSVPELTAIAETVHQVSPEEWAGMQFQAARHNSDNNFGNFEQTDPVPVSFGTDANAERWTIDVSIATFGERQQVNWAWDRSGYGTRLDDTPRIDSVVDSTRTYVLADLPRGVAPTAQLQILREGFEPVLVQFADTDPSLDRTFSAYAFSEPITYTAQIIGPDGAVLAVWPAT